MDPNLAIFQQFPIISRFPKSDEDVRILPKISMKKSKIYFGLRPVKEMVIPFRIPTAAAWQCCNSPFFHWKYAVIDRFGELDVVPNSHLSRLRFFVFHLQDNVAFTFKWIEILGTKRIFPKDLNWVKHSVSRVSLSEQLKSAMPNFKARSLSPGSSVRCFLTAATLDYFERSKVILLLYLSQTESSPVL